jgi:hypothetical protein
MKKLFTFVAAALLAVGANAQVQTVASFTVTEGNPVDGTEIEGTNCKVQLHTGDLKANTDDATILGAQLNTEAKYVQIDFEKDLIQPGDIVYFSYFVTKNPESDNTDGISVSNLKVDTEGYKELAKLYVQKADKKSLVTGGYVAQGGEKKFVLYKLNLTTMFHAIKVVRGYGNAIDFTNPALNTSEVAFANIMDPVELTIEDTSDSGDQSAVAEWKNTAGKTASFAFTAAPITISYKNSSSKTFAKTRTTGYQFNSSSLVMKITCNVGDKVTINPASYSKDGSFTVVGADVASVSIPKETTNPVVLTATGAGITITVSGAFLMESITIGEGTTGIESVKAAAKAEGAIYNLAGQKVNNDFKGIAIQNGKKVILK